MGKKLDELSPRFKPLACELIARCVESKIQLIIIATGRTQEEHDNNVRNGVSWMKHSKHLTGDAIDIAPMEVLSVPDWAPSYPVWDKMGKIAHAVGVAWGGDWKSVKDKCHFEFKEVD